MNGSAEPANTRKTSLLASDQVVIFLSLKGCKLRIVQIVAHPLGWDMQPRSLIVADPNTLMLQALAELFERDRRFTPGRHEQDRGGLSRDLPARSGRYRYRRVDHPAARRRAVARHPARPAGRAANHRLCRVERSGSAAPRHGRGCGRLLHSRRCRRISCSTWPRRWPGPHGVSLHRRAEPEARPARER